MDYGQFEVKKKKKRLDQFVSYKPAAFVFSRCQLMDWSGLLVMFLSAVWTLILTAPIHCRDPLLSK